MVRDAPRDAIPRSGVYDSADYLLHQQGLAQKRGGTAYAGPALTGAPVTLAVAYAEFPAGPQLVALGHTNGHLYRVTPGATTDLLGGTFLTADTPKLRVGGGKNLLVFPYSDGISAPYKYDGSAAPS